MYICDGYKNLSVGIYDTTFDNNIICYIFRYETVEKRYLKYKYLMRVIYE